MLAFQIVIGYRVIFYLKNPAAHECIFSFEVSDTVVVCFFLIPFYLILYAWIVDQIRDNLDLEDATWDPDR